MSEVRRARSRLANEIRRVRASGGVANDHPAVREHRRDLAAAKIEQYARAVLQDAPPLTAAQLTRLAAIFQTTPPERRARLVYGGETTR
ncbi:hypothetical protein GCM10009814_35390 [Lapillicoccus jejuensis]